MQIDSKRKKASILNEKLNFSIDCDKNVRKKSLEKLSDYLMDYK